MTDGEKIYQELSKAQATTPDDVVSVKMRAASGGESEWVRLSILTRHLVMAAASLADDEAELLAFIIVQRLAADGKGEKQVSLRSLLRRWLSHTETPKE